MSEVLLFGIGFTLFVITSTATLIFGYLQFRRIYRSDQASSGGPEITMEGNTEVFKTRGRLEEPTSP